MVATGPEMSVTPVGDTGFGVYKCKVTNDVGASFCVVNVTGAAYPPEFYYDDDDTMKIKSAPIPILNATTSPVFVYKLSWTQKHVFQVDPVTKYK